MASDITLAVGDGAPGSAEVSHRTDPGPPDSVSAGTDPMAAIGIQTLSQAVEMLRQDVEHERLEQTRHPAQSGQPLAAPNAVQHRLSSGPLLSFHR